MAYYPDGRQEQLLKEHRAPERRHGQSTTSIERPAAESWCSPQVLQSHALRQFAIQKIMTCLVLEQR